MATSYEQADETVHEMAREILERYHPELRMPDKSYVRLCFLYAFTDGEDHEPAVKLHGYPCYAVVSIIPVKQRVDKRADAEVVIDRAKWEDLNDAQRRSLIDHELTHLEFQVDDAGCLKTDDVGRPKLKMRLHDWQCSGFRSIARRYGESALEVTEARHFVEDFGADVLPRAEMFAGAAAEGGDL